LISSRFTKLAVAVGAVSLAVTTLGPSAHAVPPPPGTPQNLALVGSNATPTVMKDLVAQWNADTTFNSDPDTGQNILSSDTDPPVTIPDCPSPPPIPPGGTTPQYPNGSGAGIAALNQVAPWNQGDACYDIARSSRNRSSSDLPTDEFYAYGGDAIVPVYFRGTNGPGVTGYTDAELTAIYTDCTIVTWADLGARFGLPLTSANKIIRFRALSGTGARTSADGFFGGGDSAVTGCSTGKLDPIDINENDLTQITTAQKPDAVYYDSYGSFKDPARASLRNKGLLAKVQNEVNNTTFVAASAATITSGAFPYRRYIFNVIRTTQTSYVAALRFVGFDTTGNGYICNASNTAVASGIKAHGFVALKNTTQNLNGTPIKSTCRKNPPALLEGSTNPL
jgi:hypothetical protein